MQLIHLHLEEITLEKNILPVTSLHSISTSINLNIILRVVFTRIQSEYKTQKKVLRTYGVLTLNNQQDDGRLNGKENTISCILHTPDSISTRIGTESLANFFEIIQKGSDSGLVAVEWKPYYFYTIHTLLYKDTSFRMQTLSPMFAKLQMSPKDTLFSTPKNLSRPDVKDSAVKESERNFSRYSRNLLFVLLGWSGDKASATIEAFDSVSQKWFYVAQNTLVRRAYHGIVVMGVLIYVIGGFDGQMCFRTALCYNIESRRWFRKPSMHECRCYVTAAGYKGLVYAMGGYNGYERLKTCERYDTRRRSWHYFAEMNDRRSDASGAVHNGKLFICGGFDGVQILSSSEMYDPEYDQWTMISPLLGPRSGHKVISHKGRLLSIGGYDGRKRLRSVMQLNEAEDHWVNFVPMLGRRSNFGAAVFEGQLYVIGGYNGETTIPDVEKFEDAKSEWRKVQSLNTHRSALGACAFSDITNVRECSPKGPTIVRISPLEQPTP